MLIEIGTFDGKWSVSGVSPRILTLEIGTYLPLTDSSALWDLPLTVLCRARLLRADLHYTRLSGRVYSGSCPQTGQSRAVRSTRARVGRDFSRSFQTSLFTCVSKEPAKLPRLCRGVFSRLCRRYPGDEVQCDRQLGDVGHRDGPVQVTAQQH